MKEKIVIDKGMALEIAQKLSVPSHSNGLEFVTMDRLKIVENELADSRYYYWDLNLLVAKCSILKWLITK